jgi:hypothetical protein
MNIAGFITGKKVPRAWGMEYRFTVIRDGQEINDILPIDPNATEVEIAAQMEAKLTAMHVDIMPEAEQWQP